MALSFSQSMILAATVDLTCEVEHSSLLFQSQEAGGMSSGVSEYVVSGKSRPGDFSS